MSSSLDVTLTLSAVAVPGVAEGESAGVVVAAAVVVEAAGVETASCAVAVFAIRNTAPNIIGSFFIKIFCRSSFQSCNWVVAFAIQAKPRESGHLHKCEPRFGRSGLTITPRENAAEFVLGERGRRVLEDASEKKWRLNPLRSQNRD